MSTAKWQLQDAKNRLSEVVRKARSEGPQVITLHGADAAVVISARASAGLERLAPGRAAAAALKLRAGLASRAGPQLSRGAAARIPG